MPDTRNNALPARFDPQIMADRNLVLAGQVSACSMLRIKSVAVSMQPAVTVSLHFSRGMHGYCMVEGNIVYALGLCCERCLDEVEVFLNPAVKLIMKPESGTFGGNTEGYDLYEYGDKTLELESLVEDELLLMLPMAPKHKDISLCNQGMIAWLASGKAPAENTGSPFAILKC